MTSTGQDQGVAASTGFTSGPWSWHGQQLVAPRVTIFRGILWNGKLGDRDLIAAAPDLYAAGAEALDTIEKLTADLREEGADHHAQRIAVLELTATAARAALAKARGEA